MKQRPSPNESGNNLGPISPPSLGEIYQISQRRQRTRYRLIQGSLAAVAVAGVGIGLSNRNIVPDGGTEEAATALPSEAADDIASTTKPGLEDTPVDKPAPGIAPDAFDGCLFDAGSTGQPTWLVDGHAAFDNDSPVSLGEVEGLATSWQIPLDEVKALVGLAGQAGVVLETGSIDDALFGWTDNGHDSEQLTELADAWNVSSISIKVIEFMGDPSLHDSLVDCGLDPTTPADG